MKFLCDYHEERFATLSSNHRQDVWLLWINEALHHYQQSRLREAVRYAGCAFDLACAGESRDPGTMPVELTLAAIFLLRVLAQFGELSELQPLRTRALAVLEQSPDGSDVDRCRAILCDQRAQSTFFESYFNWPFMTH